MSELVRSALARVMGGATLSQAEARDAMGSVMDGEATPAQLAALLVLLRMRTETVDELAGFATAMRERVLRVIAPADAIDTCGTGGDRSGTFNISTAAALVAAASGVPVAKHGNRAVTSRAGSADVLEALGVAIDHGPREAAAALERDGFAFLLAPAYHPAMRHAGPVRRELGVPTAFNLLGPLANPAGVRRQVIGVAEPGAADRLARVLHQLGVDRALVVNGTGLDELPLDGSGIVRDVSVAGVRTSRVDASSLGLAHAPAAQVRGGDAADNARIIEAVVRGAPGPQRDIVLLNSAAALIAAGRAGDLREGIDLAAGTIDSGAAADLLARVRMNGAEAAPTTAIADAVAPSPA